MEDRQGKATLAPYQFRLVVEGISYIGVPYWLHAKTFPKRLVFTSDGVRVGVVVGVIRELMT